MVALVSLGRPSGLQKGGWALPFRPFTAKRSLDLVVGGLLDLLHPLR